MFPLIRDCHANLPEGHEVSLATAALQKAEQALQAEVVRTTTERQKAAQADQARLTADQNAALLKENKEALQVELQHALVHKLAAEKRAAEAEARERAARGTPLGMKYPKAGRS